MALVVRAWHRNRSLTVLMKSTRQDGTFPRDDIHLGHMSETYYSCPAGER